ncbi:MAG: DUF3488 domain-containing transglutaminase family protein [Aquificae bacterium]|nr:DUF3488 domain-containing transglutaminase family protein [Aquificota bacterium]
MERGRVPVKKLVDLLTLLLLLKAFAGLWEVSFPYLFLPLFILSLAGILNEFKEFFHIPRKFLNLMALSGTVVLLSSLSLENLISPLAETLLFLLTIKALERKNVRDYYQILLLSFLAVSLATAVNMSPFFLLLFLGEVFIGVLFLITLNFYRSLGERPLSWSIYRRVLLVSAAFSLAVFLSSWVFFLFLPRIERPLLDFFHRKERGLISGISDSVEIGEVGEIHLDNTVAFRVFGLELPPSPYWRVAVFDYYDGRRWIKSQVPVPEEEGDYRGGIEYILILEPTYDRYLPLLDYPVRLISVEGVRNRPLRFLGNYYEFRQDIVRPVRIVALSSLSPPSDAPLPLHKKLPPELPERVKRLAQELGRGKKTPAEKIESVKEFFRRENFRYSLRLEHYEGDPLEAFLFELKEGNCEYFATATALLLRAMGVPARLVSGFHGAIRNEYGNYYIVVNAMAHVWVEAYDGKRWVRVDTTPPYSPPALSEISPLSLLYDSLVAFWYKNVVDFNLQKQRRLIFTSIEGMKELRRLVLENIPALAGILLGSLALWGGVVFLLRKRKTPENLYRELLRKLKRYGIEEKSPERILELFKGKPQYPYVKFIVQTYQRWKYSPYRDKEELKEAYKALKKL